MLKCPIPEDYFILVILSIILFKVDMTDSDNSPE